ncbi:hypothetical protein KEM56_001918 [Ascosphaera pollenicola]|nr:hypothetical protein KEM56_001918 [Ascosphaera pollenicola]
MPIATVVIELCGPVSFKARCMPKVQHGDGRMFMSLPILRDDIPPDVNTHLRTHPGHLVGVMAVSGNIGGQETKEDFLSALHEATFTVADLVEIEMDLGTLFTAQDYRRTSSDGRNRVKREFSGDEVDDVHLRVIQDSGKEKEKARATKVIKLMNRGKHWVLVTLLLGNVLTNETLPIILDRSLGGGWAAVIISTGLVVIFGEILPQAICVNYGLTIGAFMTPFVFGVMLLFSPVGYPTAWLLRKALGTGDGNSLYVRSELRTLLRLHEYTSEKDTHLDPDEVDIMSSILDLRDKPVGNILTPIHDVYSLAADTVLDPDTVHNIWASGHSRVPVHKPSNSSAFIGVLFTSELMTYNPRDKKKVQDLYLGNLPEMSASASCLDVVRFFREREEHEPRIILISRQPGKMRDLLGIITLGDALKGIIGKRTIVDTPEIPPSKYARHGVAARDSLSGSTRYTDQPLSMHSKGSGSSGGSPTTIKRSASLPINGHSRSLASKLKKKNKKKGTKDSAFEPLLPKMHEDQISPKTRVCAYDTEKGLDKQNNNKLMENGVEFQDSFAPAAQETVEPRPEHLERLSESSLNPESVRHKSNGHQR